MRSDLLLPLLAALALGAAPAAPAAAKVFFSQKEAIELAFPEAERVEKETWILDDAQVARIEELARAKLESRLVSVYTGRRGEEVLGHALIDVHTVRTQPEAFLIVISPDGEVRSLRVLAFYEPEEYLPPERWLEQFDRRPLSDDLQLHGQIHGIAGSTLSARAVTSGVRRALALYEVLLKGDARAGGEAAAPAGL